LSKTKTKTENDAAVAEGDFAADCLKAHNEYREKHGVPPLKLTKKVCTLNNLLCRLSGTLTLQIVVNGCQNFCCFVTDVHHSCLSITWSVASA